MSQEEKGLEIKSLHEGFPATFNFNETSLKMTNKGFWVNGVQVEQGENEAKEVYEAFKKMIGYSK